MKELSYQQKYIEELATFSTRYLQGEEPKIIVFQAPTGSGKTIMMAESLSRLAKELKTSKSLSFIWISVNSLHEQSKKKLDEHFANERLMECISVNEIESKQIDENEILFINWESLNRESNLFIKENEQDWNLTKVIENTKEEGREVVLVIDESHRAAKTSKASEIIKLIGPKLTIEVSATPKEISNDLRIKVPLREVIEEEMIKSEIQINPGLNKIETNEDIVEAALKKRKQLKESYEQLGSKVNPLLLIQIPNKKYSDIRSPEEKIMEVLENHDVTVKNGKLAVWLSDKDSKINLDELERNENEVEVLIFKQAIAQGWDCPRAAILLLQREWNAENYEFNIQTLGRIMRMPEQKYYAEHPELNTGYIYTASDNFSIVEDLAKDYVSKVQMVRNNEIYRNIYLPSQYIRRKREQTRLSGDFKRCLLEASGEIEIKENINTAKAVYKKKIGVAGQVSDIDIKQSVKFSSEGQVLRDREEIWTSYNAFLSSQTAPYSKVRSSEIIKSSLRTLFKNLYGISNEDEIANIVVNPINKPFFIDLIDLAKQKYKTLPVREDVVVNDEAWQVPEAISVFDNFELAGSIGKSILLPYFVKKDLNGRPKWSKPERLFISELENTDDDVLWWYKNGERESKFFGIAYQKENGLYYGFYPDFIIKTKGEILVVEIKDDRDFKNENILKLNAGKHLQKSYSGKEKLRFYVLSPRDYAQFSRYLKEQALDSFKSKYEESLLKFSQSRKIASASNGIQTKEDQELLELFEDELSTAIKNLEDATLEKEILQLDLENANQIIDNFKKSFSPNQPEPEQIEPDVKIPKPFTICVLGEVTDEGQAMTALNKHFSKYGLSATDWDVDFISNAKLRNSDVFSGLKKGQSKYKLVITGQIYHHSAKGNEAANPLTELKNPKYIDSVVGSSPTDVLTPQRLVETLDQYLTKQLPE